jgi:uncharacterized membrane protein YphA (DoxX/SURF4 family)
MCWATPQRYRLFREMKKGTSVLVESFWNLVVDQHTVVFGRTFVAVVLLAAGVTKLGKRQEFVGVVRNYRLLPDAAAGFVAALLPAIETAVAVGLLFGVLTNWLAATALCLFILFGSAVAINLLRGRRNISCGCFGPQQNHHLTWSLVLRNLGLAGLAATVWLVSPGFHETQQLPIAETLVTIFVACATLASWWLWALILQVWQLTSAKKGS